MDFLVGPFHLRGIMFPKIKPQHVAVSVGVAAALVVLVFARDGASVVPESAGGLHGVSAEGVAVREAATTTRISDSTLTWMNASMPQGMFAQIDPEMVAKVPAPSFGHPAADRAMLLMDCKDFSESGNALSDELAKMSGLKPDDPSVEMLLFLREVQGIRCRNVGHVDVAQVDALMTEAAAAGNPRGRTYIAAKALSSSLQFEKDALGDVSMAPVSAHAKAAAKEMLELARTGDIEAIGQAYMVTSTDRYGLKDPVAAAAWKLVMAQDRTSYTFDPAQPKGQPPEDMPEAQRALVIAQARDDFNACCTKPAPAGGAGSVQ